MRHLVGKQLVVVTIQFRLGSLGFLSTGDKNLPGNVALWDMVLAVQWVRNYIGFFGGNPYRIFVMGHDTGASSALLLALSNVAKGNENDNKHLKTVFSCSSLVSNFVVTSVLSFPIPVISSYTKIRFDLESGKHLNILKCATAPRQI